MYEALVLKIVPSIVRVMRTAFIAILAVRETYRLPGMNLQLPMSEYRYPGDVYADPFYT